MTTNAKRQKRINYEIIVDCYTDDEVNMGWYYYFEDNLHFPFKVYTPIKRKGQTAVLTLVEVVVLKEDCYKNTKVGVVEISKDTIVFVSIN